MTSRRDAVTALIAEGKSRVEIAEAVGVPMGTLNSWASRAKVKLPDGRVQVDRAERRATIERLTTEGRTRPEIATALGLSVSALQKWCSDHRIPLPNERPAATRPRVHPADELPWGEIRAKAWSLTKVGATRKQIAMALNLPLERVAHALSRPAPRRLATITPITTRRSAA